LLSVFVFQQGSHCVIIARSRATNGIATFLKINRYFAGDYSVALRYYSGKQIVTTLSLLKQTDLKLKGVDSGDASEGQILRELVLRMML
jgi:DNA polymerase-3 subunit delta